MKTFVPFSRFTLAPLLSLAIIMTGGILNAQSGKDSEEEIPELIFRNAVLTSGISNANNATYRFPNVASGIDGLLKIKARSASNVIVKSIDVNSMGWDKALQPEIGIEGNISANHEWWVDLEIIFLKAGTDKKVKIKKFNITALDVDGDGVSIREYIKMDKIKAVRYSAYTQLSEYTADSDICDECGKSSMAVQCSNCKGKGKNGHTECGNCKGSGKIHDECDHAWDGKQNKTANGPLNSALNVDTTTTTVMADYEYENRDFIKFRVGAKSGTGNSKAGMRLNSLWFRSFDLSSAQSIVPLALKDFNAKLTDKNVTLSWVTSHEKKFSHFIIERSNDAMHYVYAGIVFSNENASGLSQSYLFSDAININAKDVITYRLRVFDVNGSYYLSSIRFIRTGEENTEVKIETYPNPVITNLKITIPSTWQNQLVVYEVIHTSGKLLKRMEMQNSNQTELIDMKAYARGIYFVKVSMDKQVVSKQVMKY